MGDAVSPAPASRDMTVVDNSKLPTSRDWRWADVHGPTIERQPVSRDIKYYTETSPGCSVVHDFERRLSRNGIKVSEASGNHASNIATQAAVQVRSGARSILDGYARDNPQRSNHHVSRSEDFPPLGAPTMAFFPNTKKETKVETLERQLRRAQVEAQVWKGRSEKQEIDLRVSYKETMEWRMKYEDLYSATLQGIDTEPGLRQKRGATKSLG